METVKKYESPRFPTVSTLSSVQCFRTERLKSGSDAEKSPKCASRDFLRNFQKKWRSVFYEFCRIFHIQPRRKFLFLHDGNDGAGRICKPCCLELIAQSAGVIGHAVQGNNIQNFFHFQIVIIPHGFDGQASAIDVFDADSTFAEAGKILLFDILL